MTKKIGIVGGGQLGRMLTEAALPMGLSVTVIDPVENAPAAQAGATQIQAPLTSQDALATLGGETDIITFEIEHIDTNTLIEMANSGITVSPHPETLHMIKDKLAQKQFLRTVDIPVADFFEIKTPHDVIKLAETIRFPLLLKTRYGGFDGRGNFLVRDETELSTAFTKLRGKELYVESYVPFEKELAVILARGTNGETNTYPVVETIHKNNICHMVLAPAPLPDEITKKALEIGLQTLSHLQGAGVFTIEMFLLKNGEILVNEIAPRVHNAGHFTIEACSTSQFTQHLLAITGQELKKTEMIVPAAAMINILGSHTGIADPKGKEFAEQIPGVHVHLYGKAEVRNDRKMGHITATAETLEMAMQHAIKARELISI
ncbi:MAG: hypothetical protein RLZZ455_813 [Candidatus Parcubacteria bacterium]|jgi:phosphoribosylaminoimidazole carboxylase PurK protein